MPADRDPSASASSRYLRAVGRRAGATAFVRWWLGELAPVVPRSTRAAFLRRRLRPVLAIEADTATLWVPMLQGGELVMEPTAQIPVTGDAAVTAAAGRAAFEALPAAVRGASPKPRIVIALSARQTLRRTLVLPAAVEENLRQALAYDLDRHTPFKADELYFDAAVVARTSERGEIHVDLAAARRGVVDSALQLAESFGTEVVAVIPDSPSGAGASRLNLLPDDRRPVAGPWRRWQVLAPLALFVAVGVVSLALPVWQKREYAIALGRQVDAARAQAAVSEGLRNELERLTAEYNFALERKFAYPPVVQVLDEITKLLPDDTWLTQMELKTAARGKETQRELMLRGESANAGRLITAFEESKVFAQAAPRSPTTKIQPGPGEIFDLVAQLRPPPPPAPVALASAAVAPSEAAPAAATVSSASPPAPAPAAAPGRAPPAAPATTSTPASTPASTPPPSATTAAAAPAPAAAPPPPPAPKAGTTPASGSTPAAGAAASAAAAPPVKKPQP